jgi:GxxExxY protein
MTENELSAIVIGEAISIHKILGPGLLEKVYAECLYYRLKKLDLNVVKEHPIPVIFEEVRMDCGYRADLIVESKLIVEAKSIDAIADIHIAKTLTYLKFANCKLGLLINFNVSLLKNGIKRVVNNLWISANLVSLAAGFFVS